MRGELLRTHYAAGTAAAKIRNLNGQLGEFFAEKSTEHKSYVAESGYWHKLATEARTKEAEYRQPASPSDVDKDMAALADAKTKAAQYAATTEALQSTVMHMEAMQKRKRLSKFK